MLRLAVRRLGPKKSDAAVIFGAKQGATKLGSDEKFSQAAIEYLYEPNHPTDAKKRVANVQEERLMAAAFDRLASVSDRNFERRMDRLVGRAVEALEAIPEELRDEAVMINSEQPPLSFRRPTLTPPLPGYEPAFGLDVPQLRATQPEYPPTSRPDDAVRQTLPEEYPFVDAETVRAHAAECEHSLEAYHGVVRETVPATGTSGEAFEANVALQRKALARQQLILDLCADDEFRARYDDDAGFREEELARRGVLPLYIDEPAVHPAVADDGSRVAPAPLPELHPAQAPKYQPIRA